MFFDQLESEIGEENAKIIDSIMSADKLHYNQNGRTMGIDTHEFIENFENNKEIVKNIMSKL